MVRMFVKLFQAVQPEPNRDRIKQLESMKPVGHRNNEQRD